MTCYQRHLSEVFERLDLPYDRESRARVHAAIVEVLGLPDDAHCPEVWAALKASYDPVGQGLPALADDVAKELAGR